MRLKILPLLALAALSTGAAPPPRTDCTPGPYIIFFVHRDAIISRGAREILGNAIDNAASCGGTFTTVAGHTDTTEPPALARKRAETARDFLAGNGIPRADIAVKAFGGRSPRVKAANGMKEPQNRRVEVTFGPPKDR